MKPMVSKNERGQVLVLLAIAFVALLAFAGLALDGGMVFSDRRHGQNAADASSLAGGGEIAMRLRNNILDGSDYLSWDCDVALTGGDKTATENAAIGRAANNNYTIDADISDKNGVDVVCEDSYDNGSFVDKYIDVQTYITGETETFFAQVVYSGPLRYTVQAVTRVRPKAPLGYGNAIISLNENCSAANDGIVFSGGGAQATNLVVNGGGIFSNSCIKANGQINVSVSSTIHYNDTYTPPANGTISPNPTQATGVLPGMDIPTPDCASFNGQPGSSVTVRNNESLTLSPGSYSSISVSNGGNLTLDPGLYCITGSQGFDGGGNDIFGDGVTFYLTTGAFSVSGSGNVKLTAPLEGSNPDPAIPGLLIYMAPGNTKLVTLVGNSIDNEFAGTIYAPSGDIKVTGAAGVSPTFNTQLIGENVLISGNASIDINFLGEKVYKGPPVLDLFR